MIKFFKSYMLEGLKEMKLDAVEYTLLMWLYNVSKVFEIVTLNFSQIQEKLPFVIKRSQFDRAILHLIECGYIDKISDKRNVSYHVNEEKFFEVISPAADAAEENQREDIIDIESRENDKKEEKENREDSRKNVPDLCELRNQKRHIESIIDPISEKVNKNINSDLFADLPAENLPAELPKKKKMFEVPTTEEIADHMYNYLSRKGFQNINSKKIAQEAERFFFFYNSNGWKVGKHSMKDWKSAASGWLSRKDNLNVFCNGNFGSGYDQSLEDFQKLINPDGFKFYK